MNKEQPTITYPEADKIDKLAQAVWTEKTLESKRSKLLEMIEAFKLRHSYTFWKTHALELNSLAKMDECAANIMLVDSDKVIKTKRK